MPTIAELKEKLKSKGLPVSGSKAELLKRIRNSTATASIKSKKTKQINFNKINSHPLGRFYISLYFQNPKSTLAQTWVRSQGLTHEDAKHFYKKIKRNKQ